MGAAIAVWVDNAPGPRVTSGVDRPRKSGLGKSVIAFAISGVTFQTSRAKTPSVRSVTIVRPEHPKRRGGL